MDKEGEILENQRNLSKKTLEINNLTQKKMENEEAIRLSEQINGQK